MFTWLESLPLWTQISVIIVTLGLIVTVVYLITRGGISAKIGKEGLSVFRTKKGAHIDAEFIECMFELFLEYAEEIFTLSKEKKVTKQVKNVEKKLMLMCSIKEDNFYRLIQEAGVPHDKLLDYVDSQFYREVLDNMMWSGKDDIDSTKSIIKEYIAEGDYLEKEGSELDDFIDEVLQIIERGWNKYLLEHYNSEIITEDNTIEKRKISNEKLYDYEREHLQEYKPLLRDIFNQAKKVHTDMSKAKTLLIRKRIGDLQKTLNVHKDKEDKK